MTADRAGFEELIGALRTALAGDAPMTGRPGEARSNWSIPPCPRSPTTSELGAGQAALERITSAMATPRSTWNARSATSRTSI